VRVTDVAGGEVLEFAEVREILEQQLHARLLRPGTPRT